MGDELRIRLETCTKVVWIIVFLLGLLILLVYFVDDEGSLA